jgi:glycosyltransferase involved in cell wall biosynthesis
MKILLIGNYLGEAQPSMERFAQMMLRGVRERGHEARLIRAPRVFGRPFRTGTSTFKWAGYVDQFGVFPLLLNRQARWADLIHICDHSNSVLAPFAGRKPCMITCHDLIAVRAALGEFSTEQRPAWTGSIYQRWIFECLRRLSNIACVSRETQRDVERLLGATSRRIAVIPNALDNAFRAVLAPDALTVTAVSGVGIEKPFLLHVGGNDWYKNRVGALRIFSQLVSNPGWKNFQLVLAGKPLDRRSRETVQSLGITSKIIEATMISHAQLRNLYCSAKALLFPSLHEGFGWPIIEAQACGCVVITSDREPMTDIAGGAAILIDPTNVPEAVARILAGWKNRSKLVQAGLTNSQKYSQDKMIQSYLEMYSSIIDDNSGAC